jgi:hypothetical protein
VVDEPPPLFDPPAVEPPFPLEMVGESDEQPLDASKAVKAHTASSFIVIPHVRETSRPCRKSGLTRRPAQ